MRGSPHPARGSRKHGQNSQHVWALDRPDPARGSPEHRFPLHVWAVDRPNPARGSRKHGLNSHVATRSSVSALDRPNPLRGLLLAYSRLVRPGLTDN